MSTLSGAVGEEAAQGCQLILAEQPDVLNTQCHAVVRVSVSVVRGSSVWGGGGGGIICVCGCCEGDHVCVCGSCEGDHVCVEVVRVTMCVWQL